MFTCNVVLVFYPKNDDASDCTKFMYETGQELGHMLKTVTDNQ